MNIYCIDKKGNIVKYNKNVYYARNLYIGKIQWNSINISNEEAIIYATDAIIGEEISSPEIESIKIITTLNAHIIGSGFKGIEDEKYSESELKAIFHAIEMSKENPKQAEDINTLANQAADYWADAIRCTIEPGNDPFVWTEEKGYKISYSGLSYILRSMTRKQLEENIEKFKYYLAGYIKVHFFDNKNMILNDYSNNIIMIIAEKADVPSFCIPDSSMNIDCTSMKIDLSDDWPKEPKKSLDDIIRGITYQKL